MNRFSVNYFQPNHLIHIFQQLFQKALKMEISKVTELGFDYKDYSIYIEVETSHPCSCCGVIDTVVYWYADSHLESSKNISGKKSLAELVIEIDKSYI